MDSEQNSHELQDADTVEALKLKLQETEAKLSSATEYLKIADEMQEELFNLRYEHWIYKISTILWEEKRAILESLPRLAHMRNEALKKLKMGKTSTAGKAIDYFINEIMSQFPSNLPQEPKKKKLITILKKKPDPNYLADRVESFFFEMTEEGFSFISLLEELSELIGSHRSKDASFELDRAIAIIEGLDEVKHFLQSRNS